jgi:drug/metabolite transporter (DMT)-like permease
VLCGFAARRVLRATFQTWSPLDVAALTFAISTLVFMTVALTRNRQGLVALTGWPREIVAINATSAIAWISFFYALQSLEPSLVQVIWAGSGPLAIRMLERAGVSLVAPIQLGALERWCLAAVGLVVVLAGVVALLGLSATDSGSATVGVGLALLSGAAISINILLCKRLHERGGAPAPLLSVRFIGGGRGAGPRAVRPTGPSLWQSLALPDAPRRAAADRPCRSTLNQRGCAGQSDDRTPRRARGRGPVRKVRAAARGRRLPASPWSPP